MGSLLGRVEVLLVRDTLRSADAVLPLRPLSAREYTPPSREELDFQDFRDEARRRFSSNQARGAGSTPAGGLANALGFFGPLRFGASAPEWTPELKKLPLGHERIVGPRFLALSVRRGLRAFGCQLCFLRCRTRKIFERSDGSIQAADVGFQYG